MRYSIKEIVKILGASSIGGGSRYVDNITIDSRKLLLAETCLFIAIKGDRNDGHDYVASLYDKGVRSFMVDNFRDDYNSFKDASFIIVHDSLTSFHLFTAYHRSQFSYPLIAITGSNGKTIVKEWLYHMLMPSKKVVRSPRSYNSQVGVPLSLCLMDDSDDIAIIEAGISQKNEMSKLERIIKPDIGIFTNLGLAHNENFDSDIEKLREKLLLFKDVKLLISCIDDDVLAKELKSSFESSRLLTWSSKGNGDADIIVHILNNKLNSNEVRISYKEKEFIIDIPFGDEASFQNCLNSVVCLMYLSYDELYIKERVKALNPVAMRLEIKEGVNDSVIVNDYYNSDISSLSIAIDIMDRQSAGKTKTIIISDFLESGYQPERLYSELADLIKVKAIDKLIGIGNNISKFQAIFPDNSIFFASTSDFVESFSRAMFKKEVILLRAAREFHFEEISSLLQKKVHRTVLEVDLNALENNLNYYRSLLEPETAITVMVKAFSYGNGLVDVANLLEYNRVDYLAVAIADEGIALRRAGVKLPVIVMNPEEYSFALMIEYDLEPEIYSYKQLYAFADTLERSGVSSYPIHVKLDTGMHRMGFVEEDILLLIKYFKSNKLFFIRSIFSHLAASDESIHDEYTQEQIGNFEKWSSLLCAAFDYKVLRHLLNSSGIERFTSAQFDMVRLGIGLYGLSSTNEKLENVSTLKTTISQIKELTKGSTVGYSRKAVLERDSRIGIIPIGYADGFNRKLGNGLGSVLVNGDLAPIIGNICMDMCMIDLTGVEAQEGDSVIIFGKDYSARILAEQLDTIPYEIITSISERVKRVYISE